MTYSSKSRFVGVTVTKLFKLIKLIQMYRLISGSILTSGQEVWELNQDKNEIVVVYQKVQETTG